MERRIPCPCCQSLDYSHVYLDAYGTAQGCSECLQKMDGDTYEEKVETKLFEEHIDFLIDEANGT